MIFCYSKTLQRSNFIFSGADRKLSNNHQYVLLLSQDHSFFQCFYLCCYNRLSIITCLGNVKNIYWQVVHTFQLVVVNRQTAGNYCFTATSDPPSAIQNNNRRSIIHHCSWARPKSQYTTLVFLDLLGLMLFKQCFCINRFHTDSTVLKLCNGAQLI